MAYYMPYASQGFCDPTTVAQMPHVGESMSSRFNFGAPNGVWEAPQDLTEPFDLQRMASINLSIPGLYIPSPTCSTGFQMSAAAPLPVPSALSYHISPSLFPQSGEPSFASQPNTNPSHMTASPPVSSDRVPAISSSAFWEEDRIVPICRRDHATERIAAVSWTHSRIPPRASKPNFSDPCADHSVDATPVSEPIPPSRKRPSSSSSSGIPKSKKSRTCAPLSDTLQPIKIPSASGALPRCPMPKCGAEIEDCDAAWRGHFKAVHHDDLCLTPGCQGLSASGCKARCPFPIDGCKACGGADSANPRTMAIESVGRHLLNIHIKVAYRCPLCGTEKQWRESACARHIRLCLRKQKDTKKRGGGLV
ncbi:hypothetical protein LXA43DRAFT_1130655 [Ganoderma leucocontextum]|nr:hypothetical protein LXA43DRAFT_1130655 [Ganoderma leucocontextum]